MLFINDMEVVSFGCNDSEDISTLLINGSSVLSVPFGFIEFDGAGDYPWEVPGGVREVKICMCGGGGHGVSGQSKYFGGGYAGEIKENTLVAVSSGDIVNIHLGGENGSSSFGDVVADGGSDGSGGSYEGDNGTRETCMGTTKDGDKKYEDTTDNHYWGGEACLGDGGDGRGGTGIRGGGGGSDGGSGGDGFIHIEWGY